MKDLNGLLGRSTTGLSENVRTELMLLMVHHHVFPATPAAGGAKFQGKGRPGIKSVCHARELFQQIENEALEADFEILGVQ